jgi:hypothetical protein
MELHLGEISDYHCHEYEDRLLFCCAVFSHKHKLVSPSSEWYLVSCPVAGFTVADVEHPGFIIR